MEGVGLQRCHKLGMWTGNYQMSRKYSVRSKETFSVTYDLDERLQQSMTVSQKQ